MNRHLQILPLAVSLAIGTLSVNAATDGDTIRMLEQQLEQQRIMLEQQQQVLETMQQELQQLKTVQTEQVVKAQHRAQPKELESSAEIASGHLRWRPRLRCLWFRDGRCRL